MPAEQKSLTKTEILESLKRLPDDATVEDFIEHLAFILGVQQGLADLEAGRTVSHEEAIERVKSWQR